MTQCIVHPLSFVSFQLRSELYLVISPLGERMCRNVHLCSHWIFLLIPTLGVKDANARLLYKICKARCGPATHFYAELHCVCTMIGCIKGWGWATHSSSAASLLLSWVSGKQIERSRTLCRNSCLSTTWQRKQFYSTYFLIPKKMGGFRPFLDLCHLNSCVFHKKIPNADHRVTAGTGSARQLFKARLF